jgi:hypothetical protein
MNLETSLYLEQIKLWPHKGNHIMANYDDQSIIVYQAYNSNIANALLECQNFHDQRCIDAGYSLTRMTWIKTNFLWMMYRSGWAHKPNQQRILAIRIKRSGFEEILENVLQVEGSSRNLVGKDEWKGPEQPIRKVILQWDPDHEPDGEKIRERRAMQLGLRDEMLMKFSKEFILSVSDVTDFVLEQYDRCVVKGRPFKDLSHLQIPLERVYVPSKASICEHIFLDS